MKKIIFISLLLAGFSAFAFCPNHSCKTEPILAKAVTPHQSPAPATDMVMFPHLRM